MTLGRTSSFFMAMQGVTPLLSRTSCAAGNGRFWNIHRTHPMTSGPTNSVQWRHAFTQGQWKALFWKLNFQFKRISDCYFFQLKSVVVHGTVRTSFLRTYNHKSKWAIWNTDVSYVLFRQSHYNKETELYHMIQQNVCSVSTEHVKFTDHNTN